jgi:hypothetical protein
MPAGEARRSAGEAGALEAARNRLVKRIRAEARDLRPGLIAAV